MAKAAVGYHPPALYSLAIIHFNGSGGTKLHKNIRAGMAFSVRAAIFGHFNALREVGHCLQDGYGVRRNVVQGQHCLLHVAYGEMVGKFRTEEMHPANVFMADWFAERRGVLEEGGLKLCSNGGCGRPETRVMEFRRCSACAAVNYCSRACQAVDWKRGHKTECSPEAVGWGVLDFDVAGEDGGAMQFEGN